MVMLYAKGQKIGPWAESEQVLADLATNPREFELRDESGKLIGRVVPAAEPLCPWDPTIDKAEIERRMKEGGAIQLAEFWKRMGVDYPPSSGPLP
jgi:hypothetical protein